MDNSYLFGAMRVFISVAECGSFSESARRLGLSQPSVSRQVSNLEEHLGVRLFQRTTRRMSLTEAGEIYYEKALQIQRDVEEAGLSISGFKEKPSGLLRISVPFNWAEILITPYLGEFLSLYPDLKIDIECNNHIQDIIEERLDLVLRVGALTDSSYIAVPFSKIRMVMCASPEYLEKNGTPESAADLHQHDFIIYEDFNQIILNDCNGSQQLTISGRVTTNNVSVIIQSLLQHTGITILPDRLVYDDIQNRRLVELMPNTRFDIKNLPVNEVFALYSNRKHLPSKVRAFIDFYRGKLGQKI